MPLVIPRSVESGPIWTPLGIKQHGSEVWLYLDVGGVVRRYRPSQAQGLGFLMSIYPDHEFWRRSFPSRYYHGQRIDAQRASWYIAAECRKAGEYKPVPPA